MNAVSDIALTDTYPRKHFWAAILAFLCGPMGLTYTSILSSILGISIYCLITLFVRSIWTILLFHLCFAFLAYLYSNKRTGLTLPLVLRKIDRPGKAKSWLTAFIEIVFIILFTRNVSALSFFSGISMIPSIYKYQVDPMTTWKSARNNVGVGDVVSFSIPSDPVIHVSRIVALGGDTVQMKLGVVYVNGKASDDPARLNILRAAGCLDEDLVANNTVNESGQTLFRVPEGSFFVVADNRAEAFEDSRVWGALPLNNISGIVYPRRNDNIELAAKRCHWPT